MKPIYLYLILVSCCMLLFTSCKRDWLDEKPNKKQVVPQTLQDLQGLLDNIQVNNNNGQSIEGILEDAADNHFYTSSNWQTISQFAIPSKNVYIFSTDVFEGKEALQWNNPFRSILYANVVLDGLSKIPQNASNIENWNDAKGRALFFRSNAFLFIAQGFSIPYDNNTANNDAGIPLRLNSDLNEISKRSTIKETYEQMISDLKIAAELLSVTATHKTRPTKTACYALLARVYLSMNDYDNTFYFANEALKLYSTLLDYNTVALSGTYPIPRFNSEVIYSATNLSASALYGQVDTLLYRSYNDGDLRKTRFFTITSGTTYHSFTGSYDGSSNIFVGLTTSEVLLMRAECYARKGKILESISDLNTLLRKRWVNTVLYPEITAVDQKEALKKVLIERRKELCFRGLRWMDLRRLNKAGENIKIVRNIENTVYELPPNDPKYALPIPQNVIDLTGMAQNLRPNK